jgi:uncharacterized protein (UPF0335 family)
MAKPDMTKTVEETFEKKDEGIEELLKKDQRQLSDAERERVGDYLLREAAELAIDPLSTFDPQRVAPQKRGEEPAEEVGKKPSMAAAARTASSAAGERMPSLAERTASKSLDTLTRFGEEVADLPAEAYQANIERAASEKRRLEGQKQRQKEMWKGQIERSVEGQRQAPGQAPRTDTEWESLRNITEEIERLEQSRKESMDPGEVYHEIQRLKEKRRKMPGGREYDLKDADLTDEGARTSYEDYLLRN